MTAVKPVIAISTDVLSEPENARTRGRIFLNLNYAQAIADAGGTPLLVPPAGDPTGLAPLVDGWLIPGGADMDAARFGQKNHPACELQDPLRFEAEAALYAALDERVPILGICYGMQFLNVMRGGTLIQHLPDVVGHGDHSVGTAQTVRVSGGTLLAERTEVATLEGASYHHQAVGDLGEGLLISAYSEDGTVEAIEDPSRPFLVGVQWHPERTPNDPATVRLFAAFIEAARSFRAGR